MPEDISKWTYDWAKKQSLSSTYYPITDSSNARAKECVSSNWPETFHFFIAGRQTSGRGQKGNIWFNSNLMVSWLWKIPTSSRQDTPPLVSDFVSDLLHALIACWPHLPVKSSKTNDIFLNKAKIAGLLLEIIEQSPQQFVILGLGMNVFSHPENVNAGHLTEYLKLLSIEEWQYFLDILHSTWTCRVNSLYTDPV